jgi:hypothetical protein
MTIPTSSENLILLQAPATTPPATTSQNPTSNRDAQAGPRDLREAIRSNIQREIDAATAQATAQGGRATPRPPIAPGQITIRRPDGNTVISMPPFGDNTIPPQAVDISVAFFLTVAAIVIGLPLARAFARRMDRRGGTAPMTNEIASQLNHLNQAVDAIALEVERISEGQRFTTRLLSEERDRARQTLPSGAQ